LNPAVCGEVGRRILALVLLHASGSPAASIQRILDSFSYLIQIFVTGLSRQYPVRTSRRWRVGGIGVGRQGRCLTRFRHLLMLSAYGNP